MPRYNQNTLTGPAGLEPGRRIDQPTEVPTLRRSFVQIIWQHRWIVVLTFVLCLAGAVAYLAKATPIYTSSSRLLVEQSGPKLIANDEGFMKQSKNYLYTQCKVLKSSPIISGALKVLPARLRTFAESDDPAELLKENLTVAVGKKDDIITIAVDSPYPTEAAEIVNAIVESYLAYYSRQKRNTSTEVLNILQREMVKRDAELRERLKAIMEFKRANKTISFNTDNSNIIVQRLIKLSDALTQGELEMTDARARYESATKMLGDPAKMKHPTRSQPALGGLHSSDDMDKLLLELTALRQKCTPDHPAVRAVESKIRQLSRQWLAALAQKFATAKARVADLRKLVQAQQEVAQKLNWKAAQYAMLEAELKRTERLCNTLDSRIKEIDITENAGALNIRILEVARVQPKPSKPEKPQVLAISLGIGLLLSVALALLRDQMDHRLRSVEEVSQMLDLPVLGVVPHVSDQKSPATIARIVDLEPLSQIAESYRTIRTAVYFGAPNKETKTLLVTSPAPGDGKTTLASNLAIAMAQAGQKVLLLDADFRKPMQHRIFQIDGDKVGLSGVLAGTNSRDQAIHRADVAGLDVLPCGAVPPNPSELLNSRAFGRFLNELAQEYDHILLDAPPIMPVTDSRILGAICDVALLVLRAEKSARKPSQQAVEELLRVGTHILGVVVNDAPTHKGRYGYYHYGYNYGYGGKRRKGQSRDSKEEVAALTTASERT